MKRLFFHAQLLRAYGLGHWYRAWSLTRSGLANQKLSELLALMDLLQRKGARRILEIGIGRGGTSLALAGALPCDGLVLGIDPCLDQALRNSLRRKLLPRTSGFFQGVSSQALPWVQTQLAGEALDAVLVDGDHSSAAVRLDYRLFLPLICSGGTLIFHDIQRVGSSSPSGFWVGGVPTFWEELQDIHTHTQIFRENPGQSGYGLGVIHL